MPGLIAQNLMDSKRDLIRVVLRWNRNTGLDERVTAFPVTGAPM